MRRKASVGISALGSSEQEYMRLRSMDFIVVPASRLLDT